MLTSGSHSHTIAHAARGYAWLWPGLPPTVPVPTDVPVGKEWFFARRQQQPDPSYTQSWVMAGIHTQSPVQWYMLTKGTSDLAFKQQNQSWIWSGGNFTAPVVITATPQGLVLTRQEQPYHPLPFIRPSYNFTTPIFVGQETRSVITKQEQPYHPRGFVAPSYNFNPPILVEPGSRSVFLRQQQPDHPNQSFVYLNYGFVAAVYREPGTWEWYTTQEQPYHPLSFLSPATGFMVPPPPPIPMVSSPRYITHFADPWWPN